MSSESSPESTDFPNGISCENCIAACCRAGASLAMTQDEVYRNRRNMNLEIVVKPKRYAQAVNLPAEQVDKVTGARVKVPERIPVKSNYGFYLLLSDCGNLTPDSRCAVYDQRPQACREYELGSEACLNARAVFGLDGHEPQQLPGVELPKQNFRPKQIPVY